MKNVMILSCNMGQGHNSCACAIKEYFEEKGVRCDVVDSMSFISDGFSSFMTWGHSFMYRYIPGLFRWGYRFCEEHPGFLKKGSAAYRVLTRGAGRMRAGIQAGGYDTVICTHVFPAIALSLIMESDPLPVRTAFVATDYTCSPGTDLCLLDHIFIPCVELSDDYRRAVPTEEGPVVTGIPVREAFWESPDKAEAKKRLHISPDSRHILLMCGSMGCGPIVRLLRLLTGGAAPPEVTAICGKNERLRKKLVKKYRRDTRVHIVGYTDSISLYMDAADLYLTKPGGISVTEAAVKRLPMAFVDTVSGCEKYNMDFFVGIGAAVTDPSVRLLAERCLQLTSSDGELGQMRDALAAYDQPNGAALIYTRLCGGETPC